MWSDVRSAHFVELKTLESQLLLGRAATGWNGMPATTAGKMLGDAGEAGEVGEAGRTMDVPSCTCRREGGRQWRGFMLGLLFRSP